VWTGIEYQVAAILIYNGLVKEGLEIIKAVRDRYNGLHRNPWDEEECGHHYARAMSSWAVLLALTGYRCDGSAQRLEFAPVVSKDNFKTFWSNGTGWGTFSERSERGTLNVELRMDNGSMKLQTLALGKWKAGKVQVTLNGKAVPANLESEDGRMVIRLKEPVSLAEGGVLKASIR
jgi:hypothetical protein